VCDGVPQCPAGTVEEGESCVAGAPITAPTPPPPTTTSGIITPIGPTTVTPSVAPSAAAASPTATSTGGWPATPGGRPDAIVDPVVQRGTDMGLVIAGAVTLGAGYLIGIVLAAADEGTHNCYRYMGGTSYYFEYGNTSCGSWPLALIPIGGAIPANSVAFNGSRESGTTLALAGQIPVTIMQITGLWILLHALLGYTNEVTDGYSLGGSARLRIDPGAASAQAGLTATLSF
jgi:hypothetical protein